MPEVRIHKGFLPEALKGRAPDRIAWLHIDLNAARPEVETLEVVFDRVVPSGIIVLDHYGWLALKAQKRQKTNSFDNVATPCWSFQRVWGSSRNDLAQS
jgi:hypothetical protein